MALNPFPGDSKCCHPRGLYDGLVDQSLGQAYVVVRYVYDNWNTLQLNYQLLTQLPPAVWNFDPADYATAAQGELATTAVQPGALSPVAFNGSYLSLINRPTLGTAAGQNIDFFASAAQGVKADTAVQTINTKTGASITLTAADIGAATAAQGTKADNAVPTSAVGAANGVPPLDSSTKIPAVFLPSYVDDVLEFDTLALFPNPGESGKLYVDRTTELLYRWSGSTYVEISPSPGSTDAVPEGALNKYHTPARAAAAAPVQKVNDKTGNVILTADDVGAVADGTLAPIATSGLYSDLGNVPMESTVHATKVGATQVVPSAVYTTVTFSTEVEDGLNEYNSSTSEFTPSQTGWYIINSAVLLSGVSSANEHGLRVAQGTAYTRLYTNQSGNGMIGGVALVHLLADAPVVIQLYSTNGCTIFNDETASFFKAIRLK